MGWTFTHREPGISNLDFFRQQFDSDNPAGTFKVLEAFSKPDAVYLLCQRKPKDAEDYITFVVVCAIRRNPKDYYNFGYKDMDETVWPYYYAAPLHWLKQLSPPYNESAQNWRYKVEEYHSFVKPKIGDTLVFDAPLKFTDGHTSFEFKVVKFKGGRAYESRDNGALYKIKNLRSLKFTIKGGK